MRFPAAQLILLLLCILLAGCKDKDEAQAILPSLNAAFPNSAIYKVDRRLLWVQTQVSGISSTTAAQLYVAACEKSAQSIGKIQISMQTELNIDGKQFLIVGFMNYAIGWDVRDGVDAKGVPMHVHVMDGAGLKEWLTQRIGFYPTTDQIRVERLQDLSNAVNGQITNLPTLAELKKIRMDKLKQQINAEEDTTRMQQVMQN